MSDNITNTTKIKNVLDYWVGPTATLYSRKKKRYSLYLKNKISTIKETERGLSLLKRNLDNLFYTRPNERLYDFDFGVALDSLLFEQGNDAENIKAILQQEIFKVLDMYDKRIILQDIKINIDNNRMTATIDIIFQIAWEDSSKALYTYQVNVSNKTLK